MKNLFTITALTFSLFTVNALAHTEDKAEVKRHIKYDLSVVGLTLDGLRNKTIKDLDWGIKSELKAHVDTTFYGTVNVIKYEGNDFGYGASIGAHHAMGSFSPFGELTYNHKPSDAKNISREQTGYDLGVSSLYFKRFTPYAEYVDFADNDRSFVKVGAKYQVNDRYFLLTDFSFPSKTDGESADLGGGITF